MPIVNKSDIETFIPLATSLDGKRVEMFAMQTEREKCTEFLGTELYADVVDNSDTPENDVLREKVLPVIVYWTYVMYLEQGKVFNTATGPVVKRSDASMPLTDEELSRIVKRYCKIARMYESELQSFLKDNADDYPLWKDGRIHTGCQRFSITKTDNQREI
ncbi:MAG: hypothetical protein EA392_00365 [Cryomorphaceae bacterium]|nr:MAG: hypothetical protein EA392_00365 [Cryomorphaceae bacterium]